jgi:dihydrofolate reductase
MTKGGRPFVSLIAAVAENRCIGGDNKLLWHLPEDLKRFRDLTRGHPVMMGRKTFESIGKPLPQRENIVISRDPSYSAGGVKSVTSLEQAIELAAATGTDEIFVIGGAEIYKLALAKADRLYLTLVHQSVDGDAFFPEWKGMRWSETFREEHPAKDASPAFTYVNLDRNWKQQEQFSDA